MNLLSILANDGFICVNKHIIKQLGLEEAVLIGEMASIYTYNSNKGILEEDWFYATIERIEQNTGLSEYKQQQIISKLCDLQLIEKKLQGNPRKRFLKFNIENLYKILLNETNGPLPKIKELAPENLGTSSQILPVLAPENLGTIYNNINNNKENNRDKTLAGEVSNQNINVNLEENNQKETMEPRVPVAPRGIKAPKISAGSRLPNGVKGKLAEWDKHPSTKKAIENYALFLMDTYNYKDATIKDKITQICRMASNVPKGIEIICAYNIDRNYAKPYKPSDYKKQMAEAPVVSEAYEGDFIKDENGEVEEVW